MGKERWWHLDGSPVESQAIEFYGTGPYGVECGGQGVYVTIMCGGLTAAQLRQLSQWRMAGKLRSGNYASWDDVLAAHEGVT